MTENQALEKIGAGVIQAASQCWKKSWNDIRGPFNHPHHSTRIRSDLLREHAAIYGQQTLPAYGFEYFFDQGQHLFVSQENACLVFRKLDEWRRAHRPSTERGDRLFQSTLIPDVPTLIVGMLPSLNWTSYVGIYLYHPNPSGIGHAWTWEITDGVVAVDADQSKFTDLIEETEIDEAPQQPKQKPKKFTPKHDPNIGESSEETGSGGGSAK